MSEVRSATSGDAPALAALHGSVFETGWDSATFSRWIGDPSFRVNVVEDHRIVAALVAQTVGTDWEILTLLTAHDARGSGRGRALLAALIAQARATGATLTLEVAANNAAALGLYRSTGFIEVGRRRGYYRASEGSVDALLLALAP